MHFSNIVISTLGLVAMVTAGKYVEPAQYKANYADLQLKRLHDYKSTKGANLTPEQHDVLDKCLDLVKSQEHSKIGAIRAATEAAFGKDETVYILTGREPVSPDSAAAKRDLLRRARDCNCSTDDNYCNDSMYCQYNSGDCKFNAGCGTLWLEECDGRCVKKK